MEARHLVRADGVAIVVDVADGVCKTPGTSRDHRRWEMTAQRVRRVQLVQRGAANTRNATQTISNNVAERPRPKPHLCGSCEDHVGRFGQHTDDITVRSRRGGTPRELFTSRNASIDP